MFFEICEQIVRHTDRHTDRQTDTLIAHLRTLTKISNNHNNDDRCVSL